MRRRWIIIAVLVLVLVLAVLVWAPWRSQFGYHFSFSLPPTAEMVNYHHSWGLDSGDEFEFAVTDDTLRDAIIQEWNLKPAVSDDDVLTVAHTTGAPWWAPQERLQALPERYGRVDHDGDRYWSLWVDRERGRLYAEYGNW